MRISSLTTKAPHVNQWQVLAERLASVCRERLEGASNGTLTSRYLEAGGGFGEGVIGVGSGPSTSWVQRRGNIITDLMEPFSEWLDDLLHLGDRLKTLKKVDMMSGD
ncbi:MAG: hypothetical protein ABL949_06580 [Fimbriimonadaceae bacterium]